MTYYKTDEYTIKKFASLKGLNRKLTNAQLECGQSDMVTQVMLTPDKL